ncbi:hypothetical protein [Amycolatopsis sp.]|uniref:hypothetical protein n=1 Tax=Amycolatopsis sp. TaxID=37632 RepID=UPI002BEF4B4C|nr:hypothetical protein [Amycolatopsis sp.]HVV13693.1 hypothetical protein [Amycolatopsis sp.]HVW80407.1 hypothetical protein [Mycobacteriales bacterium]
MTRRFALVAALALLAAGACSTSTGTTPGRGLGATPSPQAASLPRLALQLAAEDSRPARRATYLVPLLRLRRVCKANSPPDVVAVVESLAKPLQATGVIGAPRAAAEAVLASDAFPGERCDRLAARLAAEITRPPASPAGSWNAQTTYLHFSPPLTAEIALAAIRHAVLPGPEHLVYALTAAQCQQAVYLGPQLAKRTGSSSLGAFVELTSGRGAGRTRYAARRVDEARITVLGAIGGEPCT